MKDKPDPEIYKQKKELLKKLLLLEEQDYIDLYFTDECGFNLTPNIPYGWQPIGEQLTIRSSKDRTTNLFGLMTRRGKLKVYSLSLIHI